MPPYGRDPPELPRRCGGERLESDARPAAPARRRMNSAARGVADFDVLIAGGGPAGSAAAVHLSRAGLRVAIAERERFPRFKVGESLLPMCIPQFERLGVLERVMAHGFQDKFGVTF